MVRTSGFYPEDPGSIPGVGMFIYPQNTQQFSSHTLTPIVFPDHITKLV